MNKLFRNILAIAALVIAPLAYAQGNGPNGAGPVQFSGSVRAYAFAYGNQAYFKFSPPPPLRVDIAPLATGVGTITLAFGVIDLQDGTSFMPFATNAKITVGVG